MNYEAKSSAVVIWLGYVAITLLFLLPLSVLIVRSGSWAQGLLLYAIACLGSTALLIAFVLLLLLPGMIVWRAQIRTRALFTIPGTLALLALTLGGGDYPRIHDITTDTQNPPLFVAAARQRGESANTLDLKPAEFELQRAAYPDLQTLRTSMTIDDAFTRAGEVARALGWEIYHENRDAGVIEAVDTTRIMAFKDDIVIRVRGNAEGAYLDLRSVSRVGQGDLGANAKRIRTFSEAFDRE
jgi:uncharacterized protein (DUF1499 family)